MTSIKKEESNRHVGHDSTCGRLHDGHLTCFGAGSEHLLLLRIVLRVTGEFEDFDPVSHLFPADTGDTNVSSDGLFP